MKISYVALAAAICAASVQPVYAEEAAADSSESEPITNNKAWVFHPYPQRTFLIEAGWKL